MAFEGVKYHHSHVFFSQAYTISSDWDVRKDDVLHKANAGLAIGLMIGSVPDVKSFQELSETAANSPALFKQLSSSWVWAVLVLVVAFLFT